MGKSPLSSASNSTAYGLLPPRRRLAQLSGFDEAKKQTGKKRNKEKKTAAAYEGYERQAWRRRRRWCCRFQDQEGRSRVNHGGGEGWNEEVIVGGGSFCGPISGGARRSYAAAVILSERLPSDQYQYHCCFGHTKGGIAGGFDLKIKKASASA